MTQDPNPNLQSAAAGHEAPPEQPPVSPRKVLAGVAVILLILAVLAAVGILRRMHDRTLRHPNQARQQRCSCFLAT